MAGPILPEDDHDFLDGVFHTLQAPTLARGETQLKCNFIQTG